jgi:hypothetical protein
MIFACIRSHAKNRCFPSACVLQMDLELKGETDALKCTKYVHFDYKVKVHQLSISKEWCPPDQPIELIGQHLHKTPKLNKFDHMLYRFHHPLNSFVASHLLPFDSFSMQSGKY